MFFDPNAPIAMTMLVVVAIVAWFARSKNTQCAVALMVSLVLARQLTVWGLDDCHAFVLFACTFISIAEVEKFKIKVVRRYFFFNYYFISTLKVDLKVKTLNIDNNEVNYVFAFLSMLRMVVVLLHMFRVYGLETMWILSMVFLLIQVTLIAGSCKGGYNKRVNKVINRSRINLHNHIFASKRIQG